MDREKVRRRNLPHWDVPGAAYFVTTCLQDSIPVRGLLDIAKYHQQLLRRPKPADLTAEEWHRQHWKLNFARVDWWLDRASATHSLHDPVLAQIVVNSIRHFAEQRYDLYAFVVMPSHIHWLFQERLEWVNTLTDTKRSPRERITYSLNRFTAGKCNKHLGMTGSFWQRESYDHWVRDLDELERIIRYIEENPVKAGLVTAAERWEYSSAHLRKVLSLQWGELLPGVKDN
jgi:type I restriction enzyme R subunit